MHILLSLSRGHRNGGTKIGVLLIICLFINFGVGLAASPAMATSLSCIQQAVSILQANSPSGYANYKEAKDKSSFNNYTPDCSDQEEFIEGLQTPVHEINHVILEETDSYYLVSGEKLPLPPTPGYFAPREMAQALLSKLVHRDDYFDLYLTLSEENSSADQFTALLDEFNAFTIGLQTWIDLRKFFPDGNRETGVPAMMSFVSFYASYARAFHPNVWTHMIKDPTMKFTITKLWDQGERILQQACQRSPVTDNEESYYISYLCNSGNTSAIAEVIGHQSRCPSECK